MMVRVLLKNCYYMWVSNKTRYCLDISSMIIF